MKAIKKNIVLKLLISAFFYTTLFGQYCFAQSIILRPGIGFRYFSTKPNLKEPNYFDPSYNANFKFSEPAASIAVELMYPRYSYELVFNSHHVADGFSTYFDYIKTGTKYFSHGGLRQFQLIHNRFFPINKTRLNNLNLLAGIGFGIGINRPQSVYDADTAFSVYRIYDTDFPNEYIDVDVRQKSLDELSYSAVFKLGFAFKIKNVERGRLQAIYNLGLNKIVESKTVYYHTNARYFGSSFSRGNQFALMFSMPIYLKRKK